MPSDFRGRRAAFIAGVEFVPHRHEPGLTITPPEPVQRVTPAAEPERLAPSDARPSKAKLDFPLPPRRS